VAAQNGVAYWSDLARTKLVMLKSTDDQPSEGYEYGGKASYDPQASVSYCDLRTGTVIHVPDEHRDKTLIPVRQAGGQKVMQLKPLVDRHSHGDSSARPDKLWRPERKPAHHRDRDP